MTFEYDLWLDSRLVNPISIDYSMDIVSRDYEFPHEVRNTSIWT